MERVLERGRYILGEEVAAFEREFGGWLGVSRGVGLGNGTDAIEIGLRAMGVAPGDEVLTVSHTAVATVCGITAAGATPAFVDIDPDTFTMAPDSLASAVTPRTRAVVPVHLYGHPCDMDPIVEIAHEHGLPILEDCAQAHGATYKGRRVGTLGDTAAFSFYPTKNLGALGDGGFLATNDEETAERARAIREYGWRERYVSREPGTNSRLDEIQAAVLRIRLRALDDELGERRTIAGTFVQELADSALTLPIPASWAQHAYHLFVVRARSRDQLRKKMASAGVQTGIHYPVPVHRQAPFQGLRAQNLTETEGTVDQILSLPIFPGLAQDELDRVIQAACEVQTA